jgi:hypothetical protein
MSKSRSKSKNLLRKVEKMLELSSERRDGVNVVNNKNNHKKTVSLISYNNDKSNKKQMNSNKGD